MLPQRSRLPRREFHSREYRTTKNPFFVLKTKKGLLKENRIGIVIGAVAEKNAAHRNFWKRQTKANFKLLPDAGNDFLIIFSGNIKNCTAKEFKEIFLRAAMAHASLLQKTQ